MKIKTNIEKAHKIIYTPVGPQRSIISSSFSTISWFNCSTIW